jgi:hypothetical protein
MNLESVTNQSDKAEFEPSELVDYGEAETLTRGTHSSPNAGDGNYTS